MHVLEEDDGSGWVKVADDAGGRGLVPASYIELLDGPAPPTSRSTTPTAGQQQGSNSYGALDVSSRSPC